MASAKIVPLFLNLFPMDCCIDRNKLYGLTNYCFSLFVYCYSAHFVALVLPDEDAFGDADDEIETWYFDQIYAMTQTNRNITYYRNNL
jgi:hypothetical protein